MSLLLRYTRQCTCRAPRRLQPCSRRFYNSSRQPFFRFLDNIPQNTVLWSIIGLNGLVFGVSWWARKKYEVERDPSMLLFLQKHFQTNWQNLKAGRFWTLVTSMFAHSSTDLTHILFNGFTFYFMAPLTLSILGSRQFLFLYLGGGVVADLFSISYKNVVQNGRDPYTLGASG
ncbi:hypothetical protein C8F01DRAFT_589831 [Mycena amicta]|nr:hypothetical protein C8F01DRAFT_589831 [Mycena amicta]